MGFGRAMEIPTAVVVEQAAGRAVVGFGRMAGSTGMERVGRLDQLGVRYQHPLNGQLSFGE